MRNASRVAEILVYNLRVLVTVDLDSPLTMRVSSKGKRTVRVLNLEVVA